MKTSYFKRHQTADTWHYIKLLTDRVPPAREVLNFLNDEPMIDFNEFDLSIPSHQIEYDAILEVGIPITATEYQAAYKQTGNGGFIQLLVNGDHQQVGKKRP